MKKIIIGFSLMVALTACNQEKQKSTSGGDLPAAAGWESDYKLEGGYPHKDDISKIYDELDYQRAVHSYIWAIPAVDVEVLGDGMKQMGVNSLSTVGIFENFLDANTVVLTGNGQSIYAFNNIDLS